MAARNTKVCKLRVHESRDLRVGHQFPLEMPGSFHFSYDTLYVCEYSVFV
jgi:hypothetical protein